MKDSLTIPQVSEKISVVLQAISAPARLAILITIGQGEACVCHLEALLGWRQAYISQHLMSLRKAEVLKDRREGRFVYYRLADQAVLDLIRDVAKLSGIEPQQIDAIANPSPEKTCECPHCTWIGDSNLKVIPATQSV